MRGLRAESRSAAKNDGRLGARAQLTKVLGGDVLETGRAHGSGPENDLARSRVEDLRAAKDESRDPPRSRTRPDRRTFMNSISLLITSVVSIGTLTRTLR